jgi:polyhydroxybutyrate depolymerase
MTLRYNPFLGWISIFLVLAGCQSTPSPKRTRMSTPLAEQTQTVGGTESMAERTVSAGGRERSYLLYIPAKARTAVSVPVVLVFHDSGSQPEIIAAVTGFNTKADAEGFVVVYPRGTSNRQAPLRFSWNGGLCCGSAQKDNIDDVGFLRVLLDDLAGVVSVDMRRIFATGMYNGALMSYRLGCEMADRIAAIGPVSGTQNLPACRPNQPVSVVHFHGTADPVAPYDGGIGKWSKNLSFTSVEDTIKFWVTADQCPGTVTREESGPIVHESYAPCSNGTAVELYTIQDGTHTWPGGAQGIFTTDILWDFFVKHPKPENIS